MVYNNPFDAIGLNNFIKDTYGIVHSLNLTDCVIERRINPETGNYGDEAASGKIFYKLKLNINPVKNKSISHGEMGTSTNNVFEVFSRCEIYPKTGLSESEDIIEKPLTKIYATDLILVDSEKFTINNFFEDVKLSGQGMVWQHFYITRIE